MNAAHQVALVRTGARFEDGEVIERVDELGADAQAALHAGQQVLVYRSIGVGA